MFALVVLLASISALPVSASTGVSRALVTPPPPTEDSPGAEKYRPIVDQAVIDLATNLGVAPLAAPPYLEVLKKKNPEGGQYAQLYAFGDPVDTCLIQIQPAGQKIDAVDTRFVLVHEVFHCYQDVLLNGPDVPAWVEEGAAMWAAAELVPGSTIDDPKWDTYLSTPQKSLFKRTHDAVGFFGHLQHVVGTDPWTRLLPMLQAGSSAAAFAVAEAGGPQVVDDWPSGLARDAALGPAWETGGAGITATKPTRAQAPVANGGGFKASLAAAANVVAELDFTADVVTLTTTGARGHFRDGGGSDQPLPAVNGRVFCTLAAGCTCPAGTAGAAIAFESIASGTALLAATGGASSATVSVQGIPLEQFCKKPGKVDPCLVGTWVSNELGFSFPGLPLAAKGGVGAILTLQKTGAGTVNFDPMAPFDVSLPEGLSGTIRLSGTASGVVSASKGVITSLTTSSAGFSIVVDVPPLGGSTIPGSAFSQGGPLAGTYKCTKTTLTYSFLAGIASTWTRQ